MILIVAFVDSLQYSAFAVAVDVDVDANEMGLLGSSKKSEGGVGVRPVFYGHPEKNTPPLFVPLRACLFCFDGKAREVACSWRLGRQISRQPTCATTYTNIRILCVKSSPH